jgi:hypothetical protein
MEIFRLTIFPLGHKNKIKIARIAREKLPGIFFLRRPEIGLNGIFRFKLYQNRWILPTFLSYKGMLFAIDLLNKRLVLQKWTPDNSPPFNIILFFLVDKYFTFVNY